MKILTNRNITIFLLALTAFSKVALGAPEPSKMLLIRTYCFYVPKALLTKPETEQIAGAKSEKLTDDKTSRKIMAVDRTNENTKDFAITEKEYINLFNDCQKFVGTKGQVLDIKGTDASYYETFTRYYRVSMINLDNAKILSLDDPEVMKNIGIDWGVTKKVEAVINENPGLIQNLATKVARLDLSAIKTALKDVASSDYATTALSVAVILASAWFAPAYVAGAIEFLYPMVYGALFGVPSKFGISYWLVYYPGKMHAIAWGYNNSQLIISLAGATFVTARKAIKYLTNSSTKDENKEDLVTAAQ